MVISPGRSPYWFPHNINKKFEVCLMPSKSSIQAAQMCKLNFDFVLQICEFKV